MRAAVAGALRLRSTNGWGPPEFRLKVTDTNGSRSGDHADWAAARFTCA
jgi:hypothetical protein